MGSHREVDLVIVGAGAAGLGAARRAGELGSRTSSAKRWTESAAAPSHESTRSACRGIGDATGCTRAVSIPLRRSLINTDSSTRRLSRAGAAFDGTRWLTDDESRPMPKRRSMAGSGALSSRLARPARTSPPRMSSTWTIPGFPCSEPRWRVSGVSIFRRSRPATTSPTAIRTRTGRSEDGYGALVARHAEGIPVELNTPVRKITWDGSRRRGRDQRRTINARGRRDHGQHARDPG